MKQALLLSGLIIILMFQGVNAQNKLTIDATSEGQPISKYIYGHFAEHLGRCIYDGIWVGTDSPIPNINGYRKDVFEHSRSSIYRYFDGRVAALPTHTIGKTESDPEMKGPKSKTYFGEEWSRITVLAPTNFSTYAKCSDVMPTFRQMWVAEPFRKWFNGSNI